VTVRAAFVVVMGGAGIFWACIKNCRMLRVNVYIIIIPIVLTNPLPCCCLSKYREQKIKKFFKLIAHFAKFKPVFFHLTPTNKSIKVLINLFSTNSLDTE
jgi:hypothetical protein